MDRFAPRGRIWILADGRGRLIEDIDTDQIFHNAHLHITDVGQMGAFALGNLEGWKDFPKLARPGDLVAAGRNFGAGSSRQQAVDCFVSLGISALLAVSFSAIYFRNAVNAGFPALRFTRLEELLAEGRLANGDVVSVDVRTGRARNETRGQAFDVEPMSRVQLEIFEAGNLFAYGKRLIK